MQCPKCLKYSGDDWKQCGSSCPMPGSPHFQEEVVELMKADQELLASFGARLHGFGSGGVTAFLRADSERAKAHGEALGFTKTEWDWLRPLLEELRDFRNKTQDDRACVPGPSEKP